MLVLKSHIVQAQLYRYSQANDSGDRVEYMIQYAALVRILLERHWRAMIARA